VRAALIPEEAVEFDQQWREVAEHSRRRALRGWSQP